MYLAIDIGGSKTLLASFDKAGKITDSIKFKTPVLYEDFIKELDKTVAKLSTNKFKGAAVAVPGKIDRQTGVGVAFGNLPWQNIQIRSDIERIVGCPVTIENDANLAGLYEARQVPEYKRSLYLTVSTGIGAVIITDGNIDPATQDMEVGQMLFEYAGKLTDWEDFGSGRAFMNKFGKKVSEVADDDRKAWYWLGRNIAVGLLDLVATLTPEVIILGGGVGAHYDKFKDSLDEQLKIYENPLLNIPPIVMAKRPEEAVVYGCFELIRADGKSA